MAKGSKPTAAAWKPAAREKAEKLALEMGLEVADVEMVKEGGGKLLRFLIDKDGGVDLDTCEKYHRALIPLVDDIEYDYMEVSSKGIDRPLKTERDFRRAVGENVEVRFYRLTDGKKSASGVLKSFDEKSVTLECGADTVVYPLSELSLIRPLIEFTEADEQPAGE
ncbi:MAG: ribosome maturation factor RimP [Eubacteriales bacterium]|nr:ribosome maturation factor RimP [Eubacteriales bacterium]MDD3882298.1 ribosome maturation factor RimP [Eubacteriales bacterium]MDD4512044.1 ribosome maturation factor RimP [Eubacteriales bacterium]